ncbi:hypothetical protein HanXRQr2_Chr15g0679291 [Helianthus annuus]|uniref:Uncharacterized protein n=1 Tax=Helianthus annuus TaxID=4232 RepID=A0A9K3DZT2_HELAN|nr:hypothetical protein HanXRQr2_Chr15g0679291 [Helianthus annuus]
MFSTTPRTRIPTFLQKLTSFLTSISETCCGVVTIIKLFNDPVFTWAAPDDRVIRVGEHEPDRHYAYGVNVNGGPT